MTFKIIFIIKKITIVLHIDIAMNHNRKKFYTLNIYKLNHQYLYTKIEV